MRAGGSWPRNASRSSSSGVVEQRRVGDRGTCARTPSRSLAVLAGGDAEELHAVALRLRGRALERAGLHAAGCAPGAPEVHDDDLARRASSRSRRREWALHARARSPVGDRGRVSRRSAAQCDCRAVAGVCAEAATAGEQARRRRAAADGSEADGAEAASARRSGALRSAPRRDQVGGRLGVGDADEAGRPRNVNDVRLASPHWRLRGSCTKRRPSASSRATQIGSWWLTQHGLVAARRVPGGGDRRRASARRARCRARPSDGRNGFHRCRQAAGCAARRRRRRPACPRRCCPPRSAARRSDVERRAPRDRRGGLLRALERARRPRR